MDEILDVCVDYILYIVYKDNCYIFINKPLKIGTESETKTETFKISKINKISNDRKQNRVLKPWLKHVYNQIFCNLETNYKIKNDNLDQNDIKFKSTRLKP